MPYLGYIKVGRVKINDFECHDFVARHMQATVHGAVRATSDHFIPAKLCIGRRLCSD